MEFLSQILRIVIIDLVLSGDNAVVIGMAAHRLEPAQKKRAILIGGGAAIGLRIERWSGGSVQTQLHCRHVKPAAEGRF